MEKGTCQNCIYCDDWRDLQNELHYFCSLTKKSVNIFSGCKTGRYEELK